MSIGVVAAADDPNNSAASTRNLRDARTTRGLDPRHQVLNLALVLGVAVTLLTELLSLFDAFNRLGIVVGWALLGCLGLGVLLRRGTPRWPRGRGVDLGRPSLAVVAAGVGIAAILVGTAIVALAAQANNWDSMTYHLGRVVQWISRESVANYPTNITRQLFYPPWAEYALAHLYLLADGDRLVNLVQWCAFAGCVLGASLIAAELGAGIRTQVVAAALAASVPMAILQASSTQNDLVAALWLFCVAATVLAYARRPTRWRAMSFGVAVGLATLTKSSTWLYLVPFVAWFAILVWRHERWRSWRSFLVIGACVGVLCFSYGIRTLVLLAASDIAPAALQTPLPPLPESAIEASDPPPGARPDRPDQGMYLNQRFGPGPLLSNVLRGATLHLTTPFERPNLVIQAVVVGVHRLLGIDPNDARTTYGAHTFSLSTRWLHEDVAGNPLHLQLAIGACGVFLWRRSRAGPGEALLLASLVVGTLLFCLVLKWQPWHSRLHLPLFMLAAPFVAIQITRWLHPRLVAIIVALVLFSAAPALLGNQTRPLIGARSVLSTPRTDQLFINRPDLRDPYVGAVEFLASRGCRDLGLILGGNEWEYPLWVLLREQPGSPPSVRHLRVQNVSRGLVEEFSERPLPCAIFSMGQQAGEIVSWRGVRYLPSWSSGPVHVLVRE